MKVVVDEGGWVVVEPGAEPKAKPSSGVFPKTSEKRPEEDLATANTEPSPTSEQAELEGAMPLPTPPALPLDLVAAETDDSKVA